MKASTFSSPFAPVELQKVTVGGKVISSKLAIRVQDDDGNFQLQGFVSKDYQLMSNRKVYDIAEDIMSRAPESVGGFNHLKTLFNGKHFVAFFASRHPVVSMGLDLHIGLMTWNSYDGSRKVGFEVYALNPTCTNQYHSRNRFGFFAWRHSSVDQVDQTDALDGIAKGITNVMAVAPAIRDLQGVPLTRQLLIETKHNVAMPQSKWGEVIDQLGKEPDNAFGLFQALTNVASHQVTGMSAIAAGTSITDWFLNPKVHVINHTDAETILASKT